MQQLNQRAKFYFHVVNELIDDKTASVLVCGGGLLDKKILSDLGFINITFSNLNTKMTRKDFEPFKLMHENSEKLSFGDGTFDYAITHASIHHTSSPHRVLTEMFRVAKIGVLGIESRDSFAMRIFEKLGFTHNYEHAAVFFNEFKSGGINNTEIPNFVYRWTEREIEKTIKSYSPCYDHKFIYRYGTAFPKGLKNQRSGMAKTSILVLLRPLSWIFSKLFPKQQNLFAFYIVKPGTDTELFPWLFFDEYKKIRFNKKWAYQKYKDREDL